MNVISAIECSDIRSDPLGPQLNLLLRLLYRGLSWWCFLDALRLGFWFMYMFRLRFWLTILRFWFWLTISWLFWQIVQVFISLSWLRTLALRLGSVFSD